MKKEEKISLFGLMREEAEKKEFERWKKSKNKKSLFDAWKAGSAYQADIYTGILSSSNDMVAYWKRKYFDLLKSVESGTAPKK